MENPKNEIATTRSTPTTANTMINANQALEHIRQALLANTALVPGSQVAHIRPLRL